MKLCAVHGLCLLRTQSLLRKTGFKQRNARGNFPGGPVVETLPSIAGGMGSVPGQGT